MATHITSPTTRYIPQSPKPYSPPDTPSPSSPSKPSSELSPAIPPQLDAIMTSNPNIAHLTPEDTPTSLHDPLYPDSETSSTPPLAGMGIHFPPNQDPLPIELTSPYPSEENNLSSNQSRSRGINSATHSPSLGLSASPQRSRTTSPRPPNVEVGFGFASSLSLEREHPHQRVISPTLREFPSGSTTNGTMLSPESERRSLAMDGKKEPSINHQVYEPARRQYPLSGGTYNQNEMSGVNQAGWRDSAAYWLGLYFCFNLGLTLFNKVVLVSFPFPYVRCLFAISYCCSWTSGVDVLKEDIDADGTARFERVCRMLLRARTRGFRKSSRWAMADWQDRC